MRDLGVGGLVRTGAWLDSVCGMEVLSIGRSAIDKEDCVLELCGTQLLIRVALQGGWVWIAASSLDQGEPPEPICNFGDTPQGWIDVRRLVAALERSGIQSLQPRPVVIGSPGSKDCFVIA
jgi:hypothetical protein